MFERVFMFCVLKFKDSYEPELQLKIQFASRSKHTQSRLWNQFIPCRETIAVF